MPPAPLLAGDVIEFAVTVTNHSSNATGPVSLHLDATDEATGEFQPTVTITMGSIGANGSSTAFIVWDTDGLLPGVYTLRVSATADGDTDDTNNAIIWSVKLVNALDLVSVSPETAIAVVGNPIRFAVQVRNLGNIELKAVAVSLYAGNPAAAIDTATIATLPAGGTATADLAWNTSGVSAGEHTLQVVAAAPDYLEDIDDRADVVVTLEEAVVDVAFASAMTAPAAIVIGKSVTVSANLSNLGNMPASTLVGLYIDNATEPVAMTNVVGIKPGATQGVNVVWTPVGPVSLVGQRELRLTAEVSEDANPANNAIKSPVNFYLSAFDYPDAPEECVEDVGVDLAIYTLEGPLADPPNYRPDESLYVGYQIYNYSCAADVVVNVDLTTVNAGVSIVDGTDACRAGCLVPAGGRVEMEVLWPLTGIPYAIDETVQAAIAVSSPEGFADADVGNNTAVASQHINIIRADDIMLGLGTAEGRKGRIKDELNRPVFGFVDLVLHSADLQPATLSHSDATFSVSVEASNEGSETEPAAIDVARVSSDGSERQVLHTETIMVKPGGDRKKSAFEVPTGELVVGVQNVQVELLAVNNKATSANAIGFEVNRLAPTVTTDVELVSMVSVPPVEAMQGQWVEIQVTAQNNGSATVNVPIQLTFPAEDKRPERKSPRILPGETAVVSFTWKTRNYEPGVHGLRAEILLENNLALGDTSAKLHFRLTPQVIIAAIESISTSPQTPMVGEPVTITVTVRNDGPIAANIPVSLHFPSDDRQPETRRPYVAPGEVGTAIFTWRTGNYAPGSHSFLVEAGAETGQRFAVNLLPPPLDVEITGIASNPADNAMRSQPVEILVTVRNNGNTAVNIPVQLTFPSEDKKPERKSPLVQPGATAVAIFTWKTSNYVAGVYTLTARLLAENNATAGDTSAELHFRLTPQVITAAIESISTSPQSPVVGEPVTITVTVRNDGPIAANIPVTLHFPSDDRQPETRRPYLAPGEVGFAEFTWRTGDYAPGSHSFLVEVGAETGQHFAVQLLPPPLDVEITGIASNPAGDAMRSQPVEILVTVRNNGNTAVNVPIQLTFPSEDKKPERKSPLVQPGATAVATFTWKTSNYVAGVYTLTARLLAENNATAGDTSAELQFRLTPQVITAAIESISTSPQTPMVGEPVTITVTVRNDGPIAANIPVTLHFPSDDRQPETRRPYLAPGEVGTAIFTWRTGNYAPGSHSFLVEAGAETGQHFAVNLIPPPLDVEITGIASNPAGNAMRSQPVEILVTVRNNGNAAVNVPIQLTFPSADKRPERKSPLVQPGATAVATFTWKTSNYVAGVYTLTARLLAENNATAGDTSAELHFRLTPQVITAAIESISTSPQSPVVGEPVTITVTVRNDGPIAANIPVTLHFPSDDRQPETRRPYLAPGEVGFAEFTWRTGDYAPGSHSFLVEVGAETGQHFAVQLLPPPLDVEITGIASNPAGDAMRSQPVEILVTVRNNGNTAVNVPIQLTFPSEDKKPERKSPRILPGETAIASFTWKTRNYEPGVHVLRAEILLENNTTAGDTSTELQFRLMPQVITAAIESISTSPQTPMVGEPVTITVTVRNDGPIAANIPVTLHFPSDDRQPETRRPYLAPGEVGTAIFTWRTGNHAPGSHSFLVEVGAETGQHFAVQLLPPPLDVEITGIASNPAGDAMRSQPVEILVTVRNNGNTAVNVPIQLTFPSEDKKPERKSPLVRPGATAVATFTWKTSNYVAGVYTLTARLLAENNSTAGDTSTELQFRLTPQVITAAIESISTSPQTPMVGEPVTITVAVRNDGPIAANIPVTLHFPSDDRQPETRRPYLAPGEVGTAIFTWRTGNYAPGTHTFRVELGTDRLVDTQTFTIRLRPRTVDFAVVDFYPPDLSRPIVKGDWVEISALVRNLGPDAGRGEVKLHTLTHDKVMYSEPVTLGAGESETVAFTWKTLRYAVGEHRIQASADARNDINHSNDAAAAASVTILTDREITIGFGGGIPEGQTAGAMSKPDVPSRLRYSIADISVMPESPVVGNPVEITVGVRNDGTSSAYLPVTLHFPSDNRQPETRRPRVAPGATGTATFTWRTSRYSPGAHTFRVELGSLATQSFTVELLPPAVDFAVVELYPRNLSSRPVVKGDWVEVAAFVRNLGPYAGRATIKLRDLTHRETMYRRSIALGPGESRVVEFTWKTLRYAVGEHQLQAIADAQYDANRSNDNSDTASVTILTNRDITVGFGTGDLPDTTADATSVPTLRTTAVYLDEIFVLGSGLTTAGRVTLVPPSAQVGTQPQRIDDADNPDAIHRLWQSAQISATDCVRLQSLLGRNQPRGVLCPNAPALIL